MNQYGDHISHWQVKKTLAYPVAVETTSDTIPEEESIEYLQLSIQKMKSRGANVLLVPGVMTRSAFKANMSRVRNIEKGLGKFGLRYSSPPRLHALPDSMAYDTDYHMLWSGICANTELIIKDIKASGLCPK